MPLDHAKAPLALLNPSLSDRTVMKNMTKKVKRELYGDLGIKSVPEFETQLTAVDNLQNQEAGLPMLAPLTNTDLGKAVTIQICNNRQGLPSDPSCA